MIQGVRDGKRNSDVLPIQLAKLEGFREDNDVVIVKTVENGMKLSCHMVYQICHLEVSGFSPLYFLSFLEFSGVSVLAIL